MRRRLTGFAGALCLLAGLALLAYPLWSPLLYRAGQEELEAKLAEFIPAEPVVLPAAEAAPVPAPLPSFQSGEPLGRIQIPRIGLDAVWVEGTGKAELAVGPGRVPGTAFPTTDGNVAVAGHRTTFGAPFRHLERLSPGDEIILEFDGQRFSYAVEEIFAVSPKDVWVLDDREGRTLTLITCHPPYSAAQRLIVTARQR